MHRLENKRQYVFDSEEEKQELIQDILSGMHFKEIEVFEEDKIIRNRPDLKGWKPPLLNDETRQITDFGKLKALNNAGWCVENIADEFGVTIEEVNRCLEMLSSR